MFFLGGAVALLFVLLIGLTVLRVLDARPNPNSSLLVRLMADCLGSGSCSDEDTRTE